MKEASPAASSIHPSVPEAHAPDRGALRVYTQTKLSVAAQLRALLEVLRKRGGESRVQRGEILMVKLAEDRFTLAVLGQFKRGKSSLMNAVIGRDLLPTGVLPLTSAVTVLKFGPTERLIVQRERMQFPEILPVSELAAFVTEKGNPGNAKRVKTATVEVPLPFLRRGLEFVDTPGVGSSIEANTQTTYGFLPECDAALFVTSVDTPLTATELDFLRTIRQHVKKIFFIVNKVDLLQSEAERGEVVAFVTQVISAEMKVPTVRVFPVSSRNGLTAFSQHDHDGYEGSGVGALQNALSDFLSGEKAGVFLTSIIDRGINLLDEETGELCLYEKARSQSASDRQRILRELEERFCHQRQTRGKIYLELERLFARELSQLATSEVPALLSTQHRANLRLLDRLPSPAQKIPVKWLLRRLETGLLRRTQFKIRRWIERRISNRDTGIKSELSDEWAKIATDLRDLPRHATELLDLTVTRQGLDELPPLKIEFLPERPFVSEKTWRTSVPRLTNWLPAHSLKALLKRAWTASESSFVTAMSSQVNQFLAGLAHCAVKHLSQETEAVATEIESRMIAAIRGERPPRPAAQQAFPPLEPLGWGGDALASIRTNLTALRDSLAHFKDNELPVLNNVPVPAEIVRKRSPRPVDNDIAKDLKTRGCPACNRLVDTAYNFFIQWQYVLGTDERAQADFAQAQGFCPLHTWQLSAVSSPLGGSIGYARFAQHLSRLLMKATDSKDAATVVGEMLCRGRKCRVCALLQDTEGAYVKLFSAFLADANNRDLYGGSQGLCLRHLAHILRSIGDTETRDFVLKAASRRFEETAEDMQGYAIKREATRRSLLNSDENDALWRALTHISGAQPFCTPWPEDAEI